MSNETTAQEHMAEMAKHFTLDEFFVRNPKTITDAKLQELVVHSQEQRALFVAKGETTRKDKDDE